MALLFKAFFTSSDTRRGKKSKTEFWGMGIGPPIVTKIVEVHQGQLWAESPGYDEMSFPGSTFHILLLPIIPRGKWGEQNRPNSNVIDTDGHEYQEPATGQAS